MQKASLLFTLCFCAPSMYAQPKLLPFVPGSGLHLSDRKIYIVARGTQSKAGLVAQTFNRMDKQITHVGIGFLIGNALRIYNVGDSGPATKSALLVDSIGSFCQGNDIRYIAIWECDNSLAELKRAKAICRTLAESKISFDANFRISRDDTLYCSEFVAEVFRKLDAAKFQFQPRTITLNNSLYEAVLRTKTFTYFPVDFFRQNKAIRKVAEWQRSEQRESMSR